MRLPRGITGFRQVGELPLDRLDESEFRNACYAVARIAGGVVSPPPSTSLSGNFFRCTIAYSGTERTVVCNMYAPLVAIAEPMPSYELTLTFSDDPDLAGAFKSLSRFEVLSRHELGRLITDFDLSELGPAELEQVRYWNPHTLGQAIFNWWD